jgi:A/G-specific adenine glycosylase
MYRFFVATIKKFYQIKARSFAWRFVDNPYLVVVSEIMLQQTTTHRVVPKFEQFVQQFPSFDILAKAQLKDVLCAWQGLGYNRRAKYLHELAQNVVAVHNNDLPRDQSVLQQLSGIGPATAASICAFAFNQPTIFVETNIRTVFIHFFFQDQTQVHDKEIIPLVAATLDHQNPREWYYALMDYGVYLKKQLPNPSRKSRHHVKQLKFEGSDRQLRGAVIRYLAQHDSVEYAQLKSLIAANDPRFEGILDALICEGFIKLDGALFSIK